MSKSVFEDVRADAEKEMDVVREGIRISRERQTMTMLGAERIAAERRRQIEAEGWTPENDDAYHSGELKRAAAGYLQPPIYGLPRNWPWDPKWWKPSEDPIRNLEKAGALIAAEIDRLQRLSKP